MNFRESLSALLSPVPVPSSKAEPDWRRVIAEEQALQVRDIQPAIEFPDWDTQAKRFFGLVGRPWNVPTVRSALEVPSIFSAVSLIANTTGSLAVETFRDGVRLTGDKVPRLVTRPDPFRAPNVFYRDTAYYLAAWGEAWWWVAKRDADDLAMSLIAVPPWEITVDTTDRLNPVITWTVNGQQTVVDPRDMRQITFLPNPAGGLRGVGPLQSCGAAVSVAWESQEWAANFYAEGGYPSMHIKAAGSLDSEEAQALLQQFRLRDHNTPFISDEGIEGVDEFGVNEQGAQMLDARLHNRGDVANMFRIPGVLLEYSAPGSSLTYQNVQEVFALFVKTCLAPGYLEKIEQELTDLLPRSTVARFNVSGFERANTLQRWQTYEIATRVIGAEAAAEWALRSEGFEPGDVEFQPVPFAPPQAFPTRLPVARSADPVRCTGRRVMKGILRPCNKLLAESGPFVGTCGRCGESYTAA